MSMPPAPAPVPLPLAGAALVLAALVAGAAPPAGDETVAWRRHEFARDGFACEMPGEPQPLDANGTTRFQVGMDLIEPRVILIARRCDMPSRTAGKADLFFDGVSEQMEASGARVVDRQPADLGLHRGSLVAARRQDGTIEIVRSVVVARTVYELCAVLPAGADQAGRDVVDRFINSLELIQ